MNIRTTAEVYINSALFLAAYICSREVFCGVLDICLGAVCHSLGGYEVEKGRLRMHGRC